MEENQYTKRIKKTCHKHGKTDYAYLPSKNIYVCELCVAAKVFHIEVLKEYRKLHVPRGTII